MAGLFSQRTRTDTAPSAHTESTYEFLDRCAKAGCDEVREELEKWFAKYPPREATALKRRMMTKDFESAFFELFLHEFLGRTGLNVEVEPPIAAGVRPDFYALSAATSFYVEAAVVSDQSLAERGQDEMRAVIYDAINEAHSPDYFLHVAEFELKGKQPSSRAIKAFVAAHVAASNYEEISALAARAERPCWVYEDDKVRIVIHPVPKHGARGEAGVRPIGIYPTESQWGGSEASIRDRLAGKAKKFKGIRTPLVLAVNCISRWGTDWDDIVAALFGSDQISVDVHTQVARSSRKKNGLFYGPTGPRNTRVSAVLATRLFPWAITRARIDLIHNPWARYPLPTDVIPGDCVTLVGISLERSPGTSLCEVFGLPEHWPAGPLTS